MHLIHRPSKLTRSWDCLDREHLRSLQAAKLRHYLANHVVPFSNHYRRIFQEQGISPDDIRSLSDLPKIPFTAKRDLVSGEHGESKVRDYILEPDEAVLKRRPSTILEGLFRGRHAVKTRFEKEYRPILMTSTTGRSAEPVPFFYTQHDLDILAVTGRRMMEICNSRPEFRHFNIFPFAPHLAFWQMHYAGLGFNTFTLSTGGGKVMGTDGNVRLLSKIQPDALIGMPTFIYHVLQIAVETGVHCPKICRIVLGGEKVPEGTRKKLRNLCAELGSPSVEIMATYGFTEAKMAWPECPVGHGQEPTGYHLYPDLGIVEVVDPESGEPVGEGQAGEIVFTPLDSRGSVVLRYRTGDCISGGLAHQPCPACGRILPRLLGRISRVSDVRRLHIGKVKGTLVNFNELEHILDDLDDVGSWQIELRKRHDDPLEVDEIIVHIAALGRLSREELGEKIETCFLNATEIKPNHIEFHDAKTLRKMQGVGKALKEEKVVDHRGTSSESADRKPSTTA